LGLSEPAGAVLPKQTDGARWVVPAEQAYGQGVSENTLSIVTPKTNCRLFSNIQSQIGDGDQNTEPEIDPSQEWVENPLPGYENTTFLHDMARLSIGPRPLGGITEFERRSKKSQYASHQHRSSSTAMASRQMRQDSEIPMRAGSVQPQSQTESLGIQESSLPGTPMASHARNALLPGVHGTPSAAGTATGVETPRIRRSLRSVPPAVPRASTSSVKLTDMSSWQKRHIPHITVPIQRDGKSSWREPREMSLTLRKRLEEEFYSTINSEEKTRLWGKYSVLEGNCALTYIIGRGASSSEFTAPFRACSLCKKRGRLCARLVVTEEGVNALGFYPLPSKDRTTNNWEDLEFYLNSK
jgi:hypothetical protein